MRPGILLLRTDSVGYATRGLPTLSAWTTRSSRLLTLGRGYFEKKQYAQAEKYLTQVVEQNQSFADVYNMLGVIYHDQGQFARAQRAFEAALRINPAYTEAALNLAVIYNDMGKYGEAKEVYQSALSRGSSRRPTSIDPFVKGKIANMYADIGDVFAVQRHAGRGDRRVPAGARRWAPPSSTSG